MWKLAIYTRLSLNISKQLNARITRERNNDRVFALVSDIRARPPPPPTYLIVADAGKNIPLSSAPWVNPIIIRVRARKYRMRELPQRALAPANYQPDNNSRSLDRG